MAPWLPWPPLRQGRGTTAERGERREAVLPLRGGPRPAFPRPEAGRGPGGYGGYALRLALAVGGGAAADRAERVGLVGLGQRRGRAEQVHRRRLERGLLVLLGLGGLGSELELALALEPLLEARAGRDQLADDDVLLQPEQAILPAADRGLGEHASRLLERGGGEEALGRERGLGDAEQDGLGRRRLAALGEH